MAEVELTYQPRTSSGYECRLTTSSGFLILDGALEATRPELHGEHHLRDNPALVDSLFAYGKHEYLRRRTRSAERRKAHQRESDRYRDIILTIGELSAHVGARERDGWCSGCFGFTIHQRVDLRSWQPSVWLCNSCGAPTSACAAPLCPNMAVRTTRQVTTPRYCAEHRHDINGFEKATQHLGRIDDYQDWLDYERPNLSKAAKVVLFAGVAASLITPAAIANAPAIGAMLGSSALGGGLTGVAATSHGLAMLGGGAVGSGLFGMGAGMAGGVAVVAVVGSGLSGTLGAVTANAYYGDDKSFRIQQVRDGTGAPILTATGFLTEGDDSGWGPWQQLVDEMYPDRPVYRVHWGSKELAAFAVLGGRGVVARATAARAAQWAARGSKSAAKKVPFIGSALIARDIAANPWSVAHNRAQMTGTLLAAILSRVETDQFVLIGHSLGALVMATAAQSLAGSAPQPRLESVHLLGAAIPAKGDWNMLNNSVTGKVYNYRSARDPVLKHAYRGAQLGRVAAGVTGFDTNLPNIVNVDLSSKVASHSAYFTQAHLRGPGSTQRA